MALKEGHISSTSVGTIPCVHTSFAHTLILASFDLSAAASAVDAY